MQGTAADIIKLAMIEVDRWLTDSALDAKMIMQVHDELVFEVADDACDALCAEVTARMANVIELKCRYLPRWVWALIGMRLTDPRALLVLSIFNWRDILIG
jgi:hypothetical protein